MIEQLSEITPDDLAALAELLYAAVHGGASVSFVLPFSVEDARSYWSAVLPKIRGGGRLLLVAREDGRILGTVQLDLATPPNQPHRAEVSKLLVHPDARRRGIGRALMLALEEAAVRCGRTLLTLDTRTGDAAEPLYRVLGYTLAGVIPGYARDPREERFDATSIFYKRLSRPCASR